MKRFALLAAAVVGLWCLSSGTAHASWGSLTYSGYQPWWNIFAHRNKCLTPEEERLQKFWHDYYHALKERKGMKKKENKTRPRRGLRGGGRNGAPRLLWGTGAGPPSGRPGPLWFPAAPAPPAPPPPPRPTFLPRVPPRPPRVGYTWR